MPDPVTPPIGAPVPTSTSVPTSSPTLRTEDDPPISRRDVVDEIRDVAARTGGFRHQDATPSAPGQPGAILFPAIEAEDIRYAAYEITEAAILRARLRRESAMIPVADRLPWACDYCLAHAPESCSFHSGGGPT